LFFEANPKTSSQGTIKNKEVPKLKYIKFTSFYELISQMIQQ